MNSAAEAPTESNPIHSSSSSPEPPPPPHAFSPTYRASSRAPPPSFSTSLPPSTRDEPPNPLFPLVGKLNKVHPQIFIVTPQCNHQSAFLPSITTTSHTSARPEIPARKNEEQSLNPPHVVTLPAPSSAVTSPIPSTRQISSPEADESKEDLTEHFHRSLSLGDPLSRSPSITVSRVVREAQDEYEEPICGCTCTCSLSALLSSIFFPAEDSLTDSNNPESGPTSPRSGMRASSPVRERMWADRNGRLTPPPLILRKHNLPPRALSLPLPPPPPHPLLASLRSLSRLIRRSFSAVPLTSDPRLRIAGSTVSDSRTSSSVGSTTADIFKRMPRDLKEAMGMEDVTGRGVVRGDDGLLICPVNEEGVKMVDSEGSPTGGGRDYAAVEDLTSPSESGRATAMPVPGIVQDNQGESCEGGRRDEG